MRVVDRDETDAALLRREIHGEIQQLAPGKALRRSASEVSSSQRPNCPSVSRVPDGISSIAAVQLLVQIGSGIGPWLIFGGLIF
jgi:hypothetical protein